MPQIRTGVAGVFFITALLLTCLVIFPGEPTAISGGAPAPSSVAVESLADRVETALRTDVGLIGAHLRVQARADVLTVGGQVPDEEAMRRALELAGSVRGVREVQNAMEIVVPN